MFLSDHGKFLIINRSFIKWQRSGTSSDYEWQRMTTSGTTSDNEWKRVTTNDNEWQGLVQRMTTSGTTSDNEWYNEWIQMKTSENEWQRVVQRVATSDNKWQWVSESDSISTTNENGTVRLKEWMIAILSITKTDTLLFQGMDGCS